MSINLALDKERPIKGKFAIKLGAGQRVILNTIYNKHGFTLSAQNEKDCIFEFVVLEELPVLPPISTASSYYVLVFYKNEPLDYLSVSDKVWKMIEPLAVPLNEQSNKAETNKCTCSLETLMASGCQCGKGKLELSDERKKLGITTYYRNI